MKVASRLKAVNHCLLMGLIALELTRISAHLVMWVEGYEPFLSEYPQ